MTSPPRHDDAPPPAEQRHDLQALDVRRPHLFTALIVVTVVLVLVAAHAAASALDLPTGRLELAAEAALAALAAILLTRLHAWRDVGFRPLRTPRDLRLYWIPLFPVLPVLGTAIASLAGIEPGRLASYLALAALVGFVEETFFRGLILRALVARGTWRAAIVSSVLFALAHGANLLVGADPAATLLQVGYAAAIGFAFAAVALRTGAIWPLVIIHGLIDAAAFVTADGTVATGISTTDVLVQAGYAVGFVVYGVLVMPRTGRPAAN